MFFLLILNQKDGTTPLYVAAENGHEQTVQILLEKGEPNVDLADQVLLLSISSFFFFFFSFSFFYFFFNVKRMEQLLFILLLKMDMNELFNFYWRKEN